MNKELKSLLILSLFVTPIGVTDVVADGPGYSGGPRRVQPQSQVNTPVVGEYAGAERTQAAVGHYARARSLLVEAIKEFDRGKEIARPDLILNSETWKSGVSAKADELNHIISPEARETTGGVRFKESHALLNENFDKPKKVTSLTTKSARKIEKKQVLVSVDKKEATTARARLEDTSLKPVEKETKLSEKISKDLEATKSSSIDTTATKALEEKESNETPSLPKDELDSATEHAVDAEISKAMGEKAAGDRPGSDEDRTSTTTPEESETAKAVNSDEEIRARLKKLSEEIAREEKTGK